MAREIIGSPEYATYWEGIADGCELEQIPEEIPVVGGFWYFVTPPTSTKPVVERAAFGGYDAWDPDTQELDVLMIASHETPKHVRSLVVSHMLLHKMVADDGSPHLCQRFDKAIQAFIAEREPSLLAPFYSEVHDVYAHGYQNTAKHPDQASGVLLDRYKKALDNAEQRGAMVDSAAQLRSRLEAAGIFIPDGDQALNAIDKRSGTRTMISLHRERGNKHKCASCSHQIGKGSPRITTRTQERVRGYDHHHYHVGCFNHLEIGVFGDPHQVSQDEAMQYIPK